MLSFKRFLYIILIVAVLCCIFLIYSINETRPASIQVQDEPVTEREFIETKQVDEGEKTRVWILGAFGDGLYEEIYSNVRQLCEDLRLTVAGEGRLHMEEVSESDLVIVCDASIGRYAEPTELAAFIAGGGRVILAAGLSEDDENADLWPALGIQEISAGKDAHDLVFEKPLLPVQPERACYDGHSESARIKLNDAASVYIRDGETDSPILYTYAWQRGSVCLINGTFLRDNRCMGLLSGAIGALLPDFIYPVLGVKAVFLDHFPTITSADDELCRRAYGYSAEGFARDVIWPAFQGISLRTNTPYTASILTAASSEERLEAEDGALFAAIGRSVLQFGGELVYAADCPQDGDVVMDEALIGRLSSAFPGYTVQGVVLESDRFSSNLLEMHGADIRFVRGSLGGRDMRLSWQSEYTVFPVATTGNSMEDGNLFAVCSVLGAYGMVSHAFDIDMLIAADGNASWDLSKRQVGLFESEVLERVPWLEERTLSQTEDDVKSYRNLAYGWTMTDTCLELDCSGAVKGQAFFYHTGRRIVDAQGLTYQDVGNGYYLLRVQESHGRIVFEEGA